MKLDIDRLHSEHINPPTERGQGKTVRLAVEAVNTALLLKEGQYVFVWCPHIRWASHVARTIHDVAESMNVDLRFNKKVKYKFKLQETGSFIYVTTGDKDRMIYDNKTRGVDYVELFDNY